MACQIASQLLHVRPVGFGFNPDTAQDNSYMSPAFDLTYDELQARVLQESDIFVNTLTSKGVRVLCMNGSPETPDAVYPNNWFTSHSSAEKIPARFILYPMTSPTRQIERRPEIVRALIDTCQFRQSEVVDMSFFEKQGKFLEGTGAMCFDRLNKICYVGLSTRAHPDVAQFITQLLGYRLVTFHAFDETAFPIYHTNVMMCMGTTFVILCEESITDEYELAMVKRAIAESGKVIIPITLAQVRAFCGNALEMLGNNGSFLACSKTAYDNYTEQQKAELLKHVSEIVPIDVSTIETVGGGSVRCMIGELYS